MNSEKYLDSIPADNPGGIGLEDSSGEELVKLKDALIWLDGNEAQPAREPKWSVLSELCPEVLQRSRHLEFVIGLCLVELKENGLLGFCSSLGLLRGLLDRHWEHVYPKLGDDKDPTQRVNILRRLSPQVAANTPYRFVPLLRELKLANSPRIGAYSLKDILTALNPPPVTKKPGNGQLPREADIKAAFKETPADSLQSDRVTIEKIAGHIEAIEACVVSKAGEGYHPKLTKLKETVELIAGYLTTYGATKPSQVDPKTQAGVESAKVVESTGAIRNPDDVQRALERVLSFYDETDRSSPVPLLLRRAHGWVKMDFLQIIEDLGVTSTNLQLVFGKLAKPSATDKPQAKA